MMKKGQSSDQKQSRFQRFRKANWTYRCLDSCRASKIPFDKETVNKEFLLNLWDEQEGLCFWTRVPMIQETPNPRHPQKVSLDRVDSDKPYEAENIVLSCLFANYGKSSTNIRTWFTFLNLLKDSLNPLSCSQHPINVSSGLLLSPIQPPHPNKKKA